MPTGGNMFPPPFCRICCTKVEALRSTIFKSFPDLGIALWRAPRSSGTLLKSHALAGRSLLPANSGAKGAGAGEANLSLLTPDPDPARSTLPPQQQESLDLAS